MEMKLNSAGVNEIIGAGGEGGIRGVCSLEQAVANVSSRHFAKSEIIF